MARNPYIGLDPQTGDMMIRPLVQPVITPAPTYNANAFPFSPSRGVAPQQPVSPVQGLTQLGQQGLEGARNQQRTAQKVSQRVGGLLGGGETAGGLLGGIESDAALQGLFATMQAIGRPVRDLSTRMQLEKFELDRAAKLKEMADRERLRSMLSGGMGSIESTERPPINDILSQRYDPYEIGQLTDGEKQDAFQAMKLDQAAQAASAMNRFEEAEALRKQAEAINERIGTKFLSREKRVTLSYDRRDQWDKTEYRPRVEQVAKARQLAKLAEKPNAITDISLIFGLMKSLDPRSTVRDGEAQMVSDAAGAFDKLMNFGNKIAEGRSLPDSVYPEIVESALIIADAVEKDYKAAVDKRLSTIEGEGLNPEIVVPFKSLNAPDVEAEVAKIRQIINQDDSGTVDNPASTLKSLKTRGGVSQ